MLLSKFYDFCNIVRSLLLISTYLPVVPTHMVLHNTKEMRDDYKALGMYYSWLISHK